MDKTAKDLFVDDEYEDEDADFFAHAEEKDEGVWEIISQGKYMIEYIYTQKPEDAADVFYTKEEMVSMGVKYPSSWGTDPQHELRDSKIRAALKAAVKRIPKDKKSTKIDDDLMEALKQSSSPVSYYVEGIRRVGNRISLHAGNPTTAKERSIPNKRDFGTCVHSFTRLLEDAVDFSDYDADDYIGSITIDIKYAANNRVGTLNFITRFFSWELIEELNKVNERFDEQRLSWFKHMYDNPTMFDKPVDPKA